MRSLLVSLCGGSKSVRLPNGTELKLLRSVSLQVQSGEVVAISGRSGSGKTTLLQCLGLLDTFDSGTYAVAEMDAGNLSDREQSKLRGRTFGFVFQQFHLLERRSAIANVMAPAQHGTLSELRAARSRAADLLERVGLTDRALSQPSQLSGGEQQRVAIARSLMREPRLIFADEPTGALDGETGEHVLDLIVGLCRERGASLVLVTHDDAVSARADRRMLLQSGEVMSA